VGGLLGLQAERRLSNFRLQKLLRKMGLEVEQKQEEASMPHNKIEEMLGLKLVRSVFMAEDLSRTEEDWIDNVRRKEKL
jgi:hypothetical protein